MLDKALLFVRDLLDAHLRRRMGLSDTLVTLNHLGSNDSNPLQKTQNRLVMTLVMLEYETSKNFYSAQPTEPVRKHPVQRFNLHVLMSANFDDYPEALKILTETLLFFQARPAMLPVEYPQMPPGLTALQFEVENSSETKTFEMWSALGAHYLPSVLYKIRHITIDADQISEVAAATTDIGLEVGR